MKYMFAKKKELSGDLLPRGFKTTTPRPDWVYDKPEVKMSKSEHRIDPYFIQEISDRLYGPDSDEYIRAISEINAKFRARSGRFGSQFYEHPNS